jgi:CheY-specific phosphatase CheX
MLDRLLGNYMVTSGVLSKEQLSEAYHVQDIKRAKLGVRAVSEKLMTIAQAEQVNALQATVDKRFGDIAIEKGYLTDAQVGRLLELQDNSYLVFMQALIDHEFVTLEKIREAEAEYQRINGLTETDMTRLKEGDVANIIPIFLGTDNALIKEMFSMAVKNLYRLVDNHVYVGKAYRTTSVRDEVMGSQRFHGDEKALVAVSGKYEDVKKMAISYTKEEFIETEEDALDAICELINCVNGLYASEKSRNSIVIELDPPNFSTIYSEKTAAEIYVLPVFISGGEVKLFIMPE